MNHHTTFVLMFVGSGMLQHRSKSILSLWSMSKWFDWKWHQLCRHWWVWSGRSLWWSSHMLQHNTRIQVNLHYLPSDNWRLFRNLTLGLTHHVKYTHQLFSDVARARADSQEVMVLQESDWIMRWGSTYSMFLGFLIFCPNGECFCWFYYTTRQQSSKKILQQLDWHWWYTVSYPELNCN